MRPSRDALRSARKASGHTHADGRAVMGRGLAWLRGHIGDIVLAGAAWASLLGASRDLVIALFAAGLPVVLARAVRRRRDRERRGAPIRSGTRHAPRRHRPEPPGGTRCGAGQPSVAHLSKLAGYMDWALDLRTCALALTEATDDMPLQPTITRCWTRPYLRSSTCELCGAITTLDMFSFVLIAARPSSFEMKRSVPGTTSPRSRAISALLLPLGFVIGGMK
jgi:hypothetical protein